MGPTRELAPSFAARISLMPRGYSSPREETAACSADSTAKRRILSGSSKRRSCGRCYPCEYFRYAYGWNERVRRGDFVGETAKFAIPIRRVRPAEAVSVGSRDSVAKNQGSPTTGRAVPVQEEASVRSI